MPPPAAPLADLVARHRPEILRYLARLLGDRAEAEDACQETFLRAHRAFGRLPADANARAWLFRIATRSALNAARGRSRRQARVADVDPDALAGRDDGGAAREALRAVAGAVAALPPRQRAALVLRRFHDLDYATIAATTGGNAAAARANVYQALRKLRLQLGGDRP
jgi:RNA polymerase sigma-70 factor (ECF subfamily)